MILSRPRRDGTGVIFVTIEGAVAAGLGMIQYRDPDRLDHRGPQDVGSPFLDQVLYIKKIGRRAEQRLEVHSRSRESQSSDDGPPNTVQQ